MRSRAGSRVGRTGWDVRYRYWNSLSFQLLSVDKFSVNLPESTLYWISWGWPKHSVALAAFYDAS